MPFCLWLGSSSRVMMPCSSRVLSRSARMLEEMPSSDLVSSSRKCRRLPNIMSRMTSRLQRSPTTSRVRLIGQPERSFIAFSVSATPGRTWVRTRASKNRLQYRTGYTRMQLVVKCNQSGAHKGKPMSLTLYFHPLSSFCWKTLIALYENDTPFTPVMVDLSNETERAALLKLWPIGKFPVLRDEAADRIIPEAS